jgi:predicted acetyltransferase
LDPNWQERFNEHAEPGYTDGGPSSVTAKINCMKSTATTDIGAPGHETDSAAATSGALTIHPVGRESDEILVNLFQHYLHDMAESFKFEVGNDGRYRYDTSPHWENRDPVYLARVNGALAGFAIVGSAERWIDDAGVRDVNAFFVIRRHRRSGIGESLVREVWGNHPGRWLVRVLETNVPAAAFWKKVIEAYTAGRYSVRRVDPDGNPRIFYSFDNGNG